MTLSEQLEQLDELHRRGVLTDEEFDRAKARTLAQPGAGGAGLAALNGLQRSSTDRWLGGVCGGLAQAFGLATWIWRVGFVLLVLCAGTGVLLYALLWFFLPLETTPTRPDHHSGSLHAG